MPSIPKTPDQTNFKLLKKFDSGLKPKETLNAKKLKFLVPFVASLAGLLFGHNFASLNTQAPNNQIQELKIDESQLISLITKDSKGDNNLEKFGFYELTKNIDSQFVKHNWQKNSAKPIIIPTDLEIVSVKTIRVNGSYEIIVSLGHKVSKVLDPNPIVLTDLTPNIEDHTIPNPSTENQDLTIFNPPTP
jgi:hypothetical protein